MSPPHTPGPSLHPLPSSKDGNIIGRVDGVHIPDIVKKARSLNDNTTGITPSIPDPASGLPKKVL